MRKHNYFGLIAMSMGLGFILLAACSKDDGCETKTYYLDKDMDNYGIAKPTTACSPPTASVGQYVTQTGDTDDNDPNINPGCELVFYLDEDNDGFGDGVPLTFCENPDPAKYTDLATPVDCDDTDPNINPDAFTTYYLDSDGDGHGDPESKDTFSQSSCLAAPAGFVTNYDDCDDTDPNINPEALTVTYYTDSDGDGYGDPNGATTLGSACMIPTGYTDNTMDCDDSDANINPSVQITYYYDGDDDGYGDNSKPMEISACETPPALYTLQGGDCNDAAKSINPGADEIPNNHVDENCDNIIE